MSAGSAGSGRGRLRVSVDNNRCRIYGVCQQQAADVFTIMDDGRLRYDAKPSASAAEAVHQAARLCPMQAIEVTGP